MTLKRLFLGAAALGLAATVMPQHDGRSWSLVAPAKADVDVEISIGGFYNDLAPYGEWAPYGGANVFIPSGIEAGWRPYTEGHWEYTHRYGWMWVSDEPFGWATYHYGRWGYGEDIGWYWVPGTRWAPAWVDWRRSEDHVVWAPLPPNRDDDISIDVAFAEPPDVAWVAVPAQSFLSVNINTVIIRDDRERRRIWQGARHAGRVKIVNNIVVNNNIDVDFIERRAKRKVRALEVADARSHREAGKRRGDAIEIYNPRVKRDPDARPAKLVALEEVKKRHAERRKQRAEAVQGDEQLSKKERKQKRRAEQASQGGDEQLSKKERKQKRRAEQANQGGDAGGDEQLSRKERKQKRRAAEQANQGADAGGDEQLSRKERKQKRRAEQANQGGDAGGDEQLSRKERKQKRRAAEQANQGADAGGDEQLSRKERKQKRRAEQAKQQGEEVSNRGQRKRNKGGCDPAVDANCPQ